MAFSSVVAFTAAFFAMAAFIACPAWAIGGETICGVTFSKDAHSIRDTAGREILAVDYDGNVYVASFNSSAGAAPPAGASNGIAFMSSGTAIWFFNSTNAYVSGNVKQRSSIPTQQAGDITFKTPAEQPLVMLQASSGNLTALGYIVIDGGTANCGSDGPVCKEGSVYYRHNFCNITQTSKGTCDGDDTLLQACTDECVDSDLAVNHVKGYVNDTNGCASGKCSYEFKEDYCDGSILHNQTCSGKGMGTEATVDCNSLDGCAGTSYDDYSCSGASCVNTPHDCSAPGNWNGDQVACNCKCGPYDVAETGSYCSDGLDNDCDGGADANDPDQSCCTTECTPGAKQCAGNSEQTCIKHTNDACYGWSSPKNCDDCTCSCGAYGKDENPANENCNDGIDNDCDGGADYDGGGVKTKGDTGCTIRMDAIAVADHPQPVCTNAGDDIQIECTPNATNNNCITATLADVTCSKKNPFWVDGKAFFSCRVASSTTQDCNAPGSLYHTAKCSIDIQKCNTNLGLDSKTMSVYAKPGACEGYTDQATCAAASGCTWCLQCSDTTHKSSGFPQTGCKKTSECNPTCITSYCGATCQNAADFKVDGTTCQYGCSLQNCLYSGSAPMGNKCEQSTRYYGGACSGTGVTFTIEDCNTHDSDNCWPICNSVTGNIDTKCDDWTCANAVCADSGSDWTKATNDPACSGCTGASTYNSNVVGSVTVSSSCAKRNPSWLYKRPLTLSVTTPNADYQVRVALTSSFTYTKAKPDGSDIRFYDVDGSKLSYWMESWNVGGASVFWVKVPTTGTATIYIYYGNAAVTSESSGTATFDMFDNFESNTWAYSEYGTSFSGVWATDSYISPTHAYQISYANGIHSHVGYNGRYSKSMPIGTGSRKIRFYVRDSNPVGSTPGYHFKQVCVGPAVPVSVSTTCASAGGLLCYDTDVAAEDIAWSTAECDITSKTGTQTIFFQIYEKMAVSNYGIYVWWDDMMIRKSATIEPIVTVGSEISNSPSPTCDIFTDSDTCITTTSVKDFYCQNGAKTSVNLACDSGKTCSNGRCA